LPQKEQLKHARSLFNLDFDKGEDIGRGDNVSDPKARAIIDGILKGQRAKRSRKAHAASGEGR